MKTGKAVHSLNTTLNALRISKIEAEFVTVSPITGIGDYTTIYDALDSGAEYIFVKNGTYAETHNLVLRGQNLIGESPKTTIIQLIDNEIEFETHDATNAYDNGTAQVINNSSTVNGVGGTVWDTGANAPSGYTDPWLIIRGMALPIAGFVNDTTLTLKEQYRGDTQTGNYYIIDAINIGSLFRGFTVEHTPTVGRPCMKISGIGVTVERNVLKCSRLTTTIGIQTGVDTNSVAAKTVIQNNTILSGGIGIELKNAHSCEVSDNMISDQNDHAIRTNTDDHDCYMNDITNNKITGVTNTAIEINSGTMYTKIQGNTMVYCRSQAITAEDADWLSISDNVLRAAGAGGNSIELTTACRYTEIVDNILEVGAIIADMAYGNIRGNRVYSDVEITGNNNTIDNNRLYGHIVINGDDSIVNNNFIEYGTADHSIHLNGNRDVASGNTIEDSELNGIGCSGTGHTVTGNRIHSASQFGIVVNATDCALTGNNITGAVDAGIRTENGGDRVSMSGNYIYSIGTGYGIELKSQDGTISGNRIDSTGAIGIAFTDAANCGYFNIDGNQIINTTVGIDIDSNLGQCRACNNWIKTCSSTGIQTRGNGNHYQINGNTIIDTTADGILIDANSRYCTINGNKIHNGAVGIHLSAGSSNLHSTINSNNIVSCTSHGIHLDDEGGGVGTINNRVTVNSNCIQGCAGDGIFCETTSNTINGNNIEDCANGIIMAIGDNNTVEGNICCSNTTDGINIANSSDRIIITGNTCLTNGVNQIVNNGTNTVSANNIVA